MNSASIRRASLYESRDFQTYPANTQADAFGAFAPFVSLWQSRCQDGLLPAWRDFDFSDFRGWHGMIHVDELVSMTPFEMRCRLWGHRLTEFLGIDETGMLLSASPAASEAGLMDFNREIVAERRIGLNIGHVLSYGRAMAFTIVKLPCASDGENADIILSASKEDYTLTIDNGI